MIDVERLAREAHAALVTIDYPGHIAPLDPWTKRLCERFSALVLEEAAKVCDEACGAMFCHGDKDGAEIAMGLRDAIRALKTTSQQESDSEFWIGICESLDAAKKEQK